jgi:PAS domain S-box-containing protein
MLVDNAPDVIVIVNEEGVVTFINGSQSQLPETYQGKPIFDILPPENRAAAHEVLQKTLRGVAGTYEFPVRDVYGRTHWYSARIRATRLPGVAAPEVIIIATDIQAQKDAKNQLQESQKAAREQAEQLRILHEISRAISDLTDLNTCLRRIFEQMQSAIPLDAFVVTLYDEATNSVSFPLTYDDGEFWQEEPTPLPEKSFIGQVIATRQPILRRNLIPPKEYETLGNKSKISASFIAAPMLQKDKVIGAVAIHSYSPETYTESDLTLLTGASAQIGIALENARLYDEIRALNADLENRVQARTAELEQANQELSSFAYTISHDLRAPLRGIHGLSHILQEEHGRQLPPEASAYIRRIQGNARQMGQLIDDLLLFTHLGQQPVHKSALNMQEIFATVLDDILQDITHPVQVDMLDMPPAYGSRALIREAITNLLSNAIKFTSGVPQAIIQLGAEETPEHEWAYFIKDNGVGFDMNYHAKLFGIFQRLHRQDEFEGTGVGLAIVRRIIERHGGKVWAKSEVGKGATFYFTLPPKGEAPY